MGGTDDLEPSNLVGHYEEKLWFFCLILRRKRM